MSSIETSSNETVPRDVVFAYDMAIENAWNRSFKRMKRKIAASEDNEAEGAENEDALHKDKDEEIAKL